MPWGRPAWLLSGHRCVFCFLTMLLVPSRAQAWRYDAIRPLVLRAGQLTPVEKAERRVLFLVDPGRGPGAMQATSTIYVGLQLLLPGGTRAQAHPECGAHRRRG
jgi:gentisate 1,2-dioxygenase